MGMSKPVIAVVIPCFRERANILDTLKRIPASVEKIYCVDDGCPDDTGSYIAQNNDDTRVIILQHAKNIGVGGAMVTGYTRALEDGADIIVKIDGDGQMNPASIPRFIAPIIDGAADYTKGNRFFLLSDLKEMPKRRIFGNAALSFMSKLSTGYWRNFDPTNGFTAIHAKVLRLLPLDKIHRGYFFESDILFRLSTVRAVVRDIPERAIYANEHSHLSIARAIPLFAYKHSRNFVSRIFYNYFLRDFNLASVEWLLGPALMLFGFGYGSMRWYQPIVAGVEASAGTVMLSALPLIVGLQLVLSAIGFDVDNQPTIPLHSQLDT